MTETDHLISPSPTIPVALVNDATDLNTLAKNRLIVDGMTDVALILANANHFMIAFNEEDPYFRHGIFIAAGISLVLQIIIAFLLVFDHNLQGNSEEINRQSRKYILAVQLLMVPSLIINSILIIVTDAKPM